MSSKPLSFDRVSKALARHLQVAANDAATRAVLRTFGIRDWMIDAASDFTAGEPDLPRSVAISLGCQVLPAGQGGEAELFFAAVIPFLADHGYQAPPKSAFLSLKAQLEAKKLTAEWLNDWFVTSFVPTAQAAPQLPHPASSAGSARVGRGPDRR